MSRFKAKAQSATSNSFITTGRTKVTVDEIINKFPDKVTINGFDKLTKGSDSFYAVSIVEDDSVFFFTGAVLTNICDEWMEGFDTCEAASEALAAEGGVAMKLYHAKSKNNRDFVAADIL